MDKYDINDYLKDDKELKKAVFQELLDDLKCAVMNVENLLETKQRLKAELTELKAENETLKSQLDFEVQKKEVLETKNEQLEALCDTYKTCYQAKHSDIKGLLFKYKQTLRGIKAIVCGNYEIIDPQGRKDILKLITKAEEE